MCVCEPVFLGPRRGSASGPLLANIGQGKATCQAFFRLLCIGILNLHNDPLRLVLLLSPLSEEAKIQTDELTYPRLWEPGHLAPESSGHHQADLSYEGGRGWPASENGPLAKTKRSTPSFSEVGLALLSKT